MKTAIVCFRAILAALLLVGVSSCSTKAPLPTEAQRQEAIRQMPCIVALPVETVLRDDGIVAYDEAAQLQSGAAYMDTVLAGQLAGRNHVRVLSSRQLMALIPEGSAASQQLIDRVATELKCNGILVTTLSRYEQRIGGNYGVERPASVTFTMKLYDARQGAVLWHGMFAETQESLFANLLSFDTAAKRKLRWITAEEMAEQGLIEKVRECPYL